MTKPTLTELVATRKDLAATILVSDHYAAIGIAEELARTLAVACIQEERLARSIASAASSEEWEDFVEPWHSDAVELLAHHLGPSWRDHE